MQRAKTRKRSEWARLEKAMRSSGMTQTAWCIANEINLSSMRNSIKRRKGSKEETISAKEPAAPINWIEAVPVSRNITPAITSAGIEVITGRYAIKVSVGFDRLTFIDICEALSAL
jgi:hypothetical protein